MPHTGSSNGERQYRQITGQSSNLGAVANAFAALLFLYTVLMLEQKEANTFSFRDQ